MNAQAHHWYMPGSVLNALWGNIMPRLAASVWSGALKWPPSTSPQTFDRESKGCPGEGEARRELKAYPVEGEALKEFAGRLVTIAFGTPKAYVMAAEGRNRLTTAQLSTLVATEYFFPGPAKKFLTNRPAADSIMRLRVIESEGYDFVLSDKGLDVFVPPTPGKDGPGPPYGEAERRAAQQEVLQFYKFRETGKPPIGLPRAPATAFDPLDGSFITIRQLTAPTGAFQVPEAWVRGMASEVCWWMSGSLYRGIMAAFPRIIASTWYEEVAWDESKYSPKGTPQTYQYQFHYGGLKELIEERVETVLPEVLGIHVGSRPAWLPDNAPGWNEKDIMVTHEGLYFPDPGPAPDWDELLAAIEGGIAGNPVFTDSNPTCA